MNHFSALIETLGPEKTELEQGNILMVLGPRLRKLEWNPPLHISI